MLEEMYVVCVCVCVRALMFTFQILQIGNLQVFNIYFPIVHEGTSQILKQCNSTWIHYDGDCIK